MDIEDINKYTNDKELFEKYSQILISLIEWINNYNKSDMYKIQQNFAKEFNRLSRIYSKKHNIIIKKSSLLNVYRQWGTPPHPRIEIIEHFNEAIREHPNEAIREKLGVKTNFGVEGVKSQPEGMGCLSPSNLLKILLQKKPCRNISGITSVTLLTSPHPNGQSFSCEHDCYYCPNEPAHEGNNFQEQPRSYLYNEPAVKRANDNKFLAIDQMLSRLNTLYMNGHEIDKLEIILEGGTYTEYPPEYLEEFNRDIFYIANTYFDSEPRREKFSISKEMKINETTKVHIIGICIETRPDAISDIWIQRFRLWGITRIQIGVQHVDNKILKKINRGHTIEQALDAMKYLKDNAFKIDIHIMPDLPTATPEIDKEMFDFVYTKLHPDQMKIYPCEVVPWTVIQKWYKEGKYIPYSEHCMRDLFDVIKYGMENCPPYIRLPRVIRDIPVSYIEAGNPHSNLRQMLEKELEKEGKVCSDIRAREIGRHLKYYNEPAKYTITKFDANGGTEYFIAYESWDKKALFGFLRMRFPSKNHNPVFQILKGKALIRELHVYGSTNSVGSYCNDNNINSAQHKGIGTKLLKIAENIAKRNLYPGIIVISGEGVKDYYRKRGYQDIETYMCKTFVINKMITNIYLFCKKNNLYLILYLVIPLYLITPLCLITTIIFTSIPAFNILS